MTETDELIEDLTWIRQRVRNCRGAIESGQMTDKDVHGSLLKVTERLDDIIQRLRVPAAAPTRAVGHIAIFVPSENAPADLPDFEDPRVKIVYERLCDIEQPPNPEEHWEGWNARKIVAALCSPARDRADYKIGWWLSAALEDPKVCDEMKADINAWFEAHQPGLVMPPAPVSRPHRQEGQ